MCQQHWTTVTASRFEHEQRGLARIRTALTALPRWRAWSNFTFATAEGQLFEVDLLIAVPNGLHLIELKSWRGSIEERDGKWVQHTEQGQLLGHGNAMALANHKSAALSRLLRAAGESVRVRCAICFTNDQLRIDLTALDRRRIHTVDTLIRMLGRPAHNDRHRMSSARVERLAEALEAMGITDEPSQLRQAGRPDLQSVVDRLFVTEEGDESLGVERPDTGGDVR
ncbi:nuclease-related domain-containing protein [Nocardia sp. CC227C]|uniref:nuclease-related domain-containing protein n=1 Tax=Nocardia sp. CC227C TaxID=3044562 RepID=UPI00278C6878|nr:nuclease-related domain-containing protein [Nocardia sp. CC227C]